MLPSTIKKEASEDADAPGSSSYKKKKESKDKANSSRSIPASDPGFGCPCPSFPSRQGTLTPHGGFSLSSITLLSLNFLICKMGRISGASLLWCHKD